MVNYTNEKHKSKVFLVIVSPFFVVSEGKMVANLTLMGNTEAYLLHCYEMNWIFCCRIDP